MLLHYVFNRLRQCKHNCHVHWETKKFMWITSFRRLLYCGLEPNLQYLPGVPVQNAICILSEEIYIYIRYISNTVFYLVDCCKLHKLYSSRFPNSTVSNTQCCIYSHFYIFIYMHIYEKSMYLWLISQIGKLHRVLAQLLVGESDILGTLSCKITGLCISFDAF